MIMRGQDICSCQDEATTSPSSSESEEAKMEESSEEIYSQEEGQSLMVKEEVYVLYNWQFVSQSL